MKALRTGSIALALGLLATGLEAPQATANPFGQFTGSWSGNGTITVQDGSRERIRCRGQYRSSDGGNALKLELRCASDSYKFELQSDIAYDGGSVSGNWNETTRNVFGSLSGRASTNAIQAVASSVGFTAQLSLTARGNQQRVSIRSPGSEISEVAISLARSGR